MLTCEQCESDDIDLIEKLDDGRLSVFCQACGHAWIRGTAKVAPKVVDTFAAARKRFPGPGQVDPARLERVERFKRDFLTRRPEPLPEVAAYWRRYQEVFSQDGLRVCDPQDLKDFANTEIGARPGNMAMFNTAWNNMGTEAAAQRTRDTIEFLLYGPDRLPMEDRLTILIHEGRWPRHARLQGIATDQGALHRAPGSVLAAPHLQQPEWRQAGDRQARLRS